jgi:hypothetical protein
MHKSLIVNIFFSCHPLSMHFKSDQLCFCLTILNHTIFKMETLIKALNNNRKQCKPTSSPSLCLPFGCLKRHAAIVWSHDTVTWVVAGSLALPRLIITDCFHWKMQADMH